VDRAVNPFHSSSGAIAVGYVVFKIVEFLFCRSIVLLYIYLQLIMIRLYIVMNFAIRIQAGRMKGKETMDADTLFFKIESFNGCSNGLFWI
jgi:hypothetical protein